MRKVSNKLYFRLKEGRVEQYIKQFHPAMHNHDHLHDYTFLPSSTCLPSFSDGETHFPHSARKESAMKGIDESVERSECETGVSSTEADHRFDYLVWLEGRLLKQVTDFQILFKKLKIHSDAKSISLVLGDQPSPHGTFIRIHDQSVRNKQKCVQLLYAELEPIFYREFPMPFYYKILIPRALVYEAKRQTKLILSRFPEGTLAFFPQKDKSQFALDVDLVVIQAKKIKDVAALASRIYETAFNRLKTTNFTMPNRYELGKCKLSLIVKLHNNKIDEALRDFIRRAENDKSIKSSVVPIKKQHAVQFAIEGQLVSLEAVTTCFVEQFAQDQPLYVVLSQRQANSLYKNDRLLLNHIKAKAGYHQVFCDRHLKVADKREVIVIHGPAEQKCRLALYLLPWMNEGSGDRRGYRVSLPHHRRS